MACEPAAVPPDIDSDADAAAYAANVQYSISCAYLSDVAEPTFQWQQALAGLIGVYGLVRQYQIMKDYLDLAREQVEQADRLTELAERNYAEISLRAFTCNKELFERYRTKFAGYEDQYLAKAFTPNEFTPDYDAQKGRVLGTVQQIFDQARLQRNRVRGKYNVGRACHDNTFFAVEAAKAKVAAVDHAYRFEEARAFRYDQWYWQRCSQGLAAVSDIRAHVVSGVNSAGAVASNGFGNVANAFGQRAGAVANLDGAFSNLGNFFGGVAQQGLNFAFYNAGRANAASYAPQAGGFIGANYGMGAQIPQQNAAFSVGSQLPTATGALGGVGGLYDGLIEPGSIQPRPFLPSVLTAGERG